MTAPTFVVGTGRCGSTMLSNMLREHSKVLSLSEFFAMVTYGQGLDQSFSDIRIDGRSFWTTLTAVIPWTSFAISRQIDVPEVLYRYNDPTARYTPQTGIPSILLVTLPHLTDNPDELFKILEDEVGNWPVATIDCHYRRLFGWLLQHFNKQLWIERSGPGLRMVPQFLRLFPDARFVHLVRDGRDVAISLQEMESFRLAMAFNRIGGILGADPLLSQNRTHAHRLPAELLAFLPENFNIDSFRAHRDPLPQCGTYWTSQIQSGMNILRKLPSNRLLTLRYEDFFIDPKVQIDKLAAFLGEDYIDEDWSAFCAATVRPPRSTWRDLPGDEARLLTEVCRPGFELLRAADVEYEY